MLRAGLTALLLAATAACQAAGTPAGQSTPPAAPLWLSLPGGEGPGAGKHVVLIAGDEEYRSEEALPQLARILSARHGFRCTVLFSTNPEDGTIDPEARGNIPGLHLLDEADLLILFTRFRRLPDADMKHVSDWVEGGVKPLIGIRTATHAFAYAAGERSQYANWSWDSTVEPGGFGKRVLGETWVAHHGHHGSESTRGVVPEAARAHPIVRGVTDAWGPTDVYAIGTLPSDAVVLLEGEVLDGMTRDATPVTDGRNAPRMPVAWARQIDTGYGDPQRVVCSTLGAAVDLADEGLRRLLVNAAYWCVGLEAAIPEASDVRIVGEYAPTMFGFGGAKKGVRVGDLEK
jgi:type 1 glutamine amidotransferase